MLIAALGLASAPALGTDWKKVALTPFVGRVVQQIDASGSLGACRYEGWRADSIKGACDVWRPRFEQIIGNDAAKSALRGKELIAESGNLVGQDNAASALRREGALMQMMVSEVAKTYSEDGRALTCAAIVMPPQPKNDAKDCAGMPRPSGLAAQDGPYRIVSYRAIYSRAAR